MRVCLYCQADIGSRYPNAKLCQSCSDVSRRRVGAIKPGRLCFDCQTNIDDRGRSCVRCVACNKKSEDARIQAGVNRRREGLESGEQFCEGCQDSGPAILFRSKQADCCRACDAAYKAAEAEYRARRRA